MLVNNCFTDKKSRWLLASTCSISLFALCLLSFPKGYIVGSVALLLCSLLAACAKRLAWHHTLTLLAVAFTLALVPHVINLIQGTTELSDIKKAARGIPLLLIGAFLLHNKPKKEFVYISFAISLIISFVIMLNEQFTGFNRGDYVDFNLNPLMMTITAISAFILPKTNTSNIYLRALMYIALTLTVATVIMSESKGPILALFVVLLIFSCCSLMSKKLSFPASKKNIIFLWMLVLSATTITAAFTNNAFTARMFEAKDNLLALIEAPHQENQTVNTFKVTEPLIKHTEVPHAKREMSSSGIRLQLWKGALILASEKPIFGYGKLAAQDRMLELVDEGRLEYYIRDYATSHFHSIYFNALGQSGVTGLIAILLLLIIPAYILLKNKETEPLYSFGGLLVIVNYMVTGIGDVSLSSTLPSITYFLLMALCVSQVSVNRDKLS